MSTEKKKGPSLQTRRTPKWLFWELSRRFGPFSCDLFASPRNALLPLYFTRQDNALEQVWPDNGFGNSPFAIMGDAVAKAHAEALRGIHSVLLGPVGGSQDWFHELAMRWTIWQPDVRINYDMPNGAPTWGADRDSVVIAFGPRHENPRWRKGVFEVRRLPLQHVAPRRALRVA